MAKLEDLEVLKCSPELNNVKIGQVNLGLLFQHFCFTIYGHGSHFGQVT